MTLSALDALREAFADLRNALDGDDMAQVDAATARVREATAQVRAQGAWRDEPAVREKLNSLMPIIDAARVRTNVLTDNARQRMDLLAAHGADHAPLTYRR
ncbi:hypothetical protein [Sphingobium sp. BS19]|uniref:hypothetical protein n=1 Tax=Sphingobium sp. BS19 TaxID=3018973 RepID=UPI0022EED201|nr:hypothetical protein [Sphingobium sp. BS19]GLI97772.1 hypothetical protein Sbs19_15900 [Sphingobium sp. BS19]